MHPVVVDDDLTPPAADWIDDLERLPAGEQPAAPEVRLVGYPVQLGVRQQNRTADLLRELQLIELDGGQHPAHTSTPEQLITFAAALYDTFGPALEEPREELDRAFATGVATIEQRYPLTPGSRAAMLSYARLMEQGDEFCRTGLVMNLAPDPEVYALRRWIVEEFVRQYAGEAPRPWAAAYGEIPAQQAGSEREPA